MRFTKLQQEFIDRECSKGSYVAFPLAMLKGNEYRAWKKDRRKKSGLTRHKREHILGADSLG